jgi:Ca2+-binding RTX toxin-like protein
MRRACNLMVTLGALASLLVLAPGAFAATGTPSPSAGNPFGCRASGARVELGGATVAEPIVANAPTYPCYTASQGVATVSIPTGNSNSILGGPVGAFTDVAGSSDGSVAYGAAAVASVKGVTIPTGSGVVTVVGPAEADAGYECENGSVVGFGQSTLNVIYVNGKKTTLPTPGKPTTITLGGGAYIALNEKIQSASSITERVVDIHLASGSEIVVGEAQVTQNGTNPCAGVTGAPPSLEICPPGSTLNVVAQACEIILNGGKTVIYVSRPFKGPSGGTVVALSVARKRYHSPCLYGPGPKYALVATKRGGHVEGTLYSDRILALGAFERVAGLGGNDCIDGKGGNQKLFDGNGKDRVWASGGFNRIGVGNGNDQVNGRNGRDWITAGNGNDTVRGGRGNSRIDVGIGHDHVYGGPGRNRIWAAGDNARVSCGSGGHNLAFVRRRAYSYALSHGCTRVIRLK